MSEGETPGPLDGLGRRIADQQRRRGPTPPISGRQPQEGSALGFGMRIGTELVAALVVGVGIGWLLDRWLGTRPWLMILFVVLGIGAGFTNVYRAISDMGRKG